MSSETQIIPHFKPPPSTSPPPHPDHPNPPLQIQPTTLKSSSSSKWLQRLRSSRGFPDSSDHTNLEHFLSSSNHQPPLPDPPTHVTQPRDTTLPTNNNNNNNNKHDLINNVLSELFYMGDYHKNLNNNNNNINNNINNKKKSCRKQPCPRICVVGDVSTVRKARLNSRGRGKIKERREVKEVKKGRVDCVGEEEERGDFGGYSQTEVTVIDTSVECWKFEKVLYRNKNVWRVGDRKGKGTLMSGDRNKRKERGDEDDDDDDVKLKKKKKLKKKLKLNCVDNKGHGKGKMMVAANEKKRDNCSQVQEKSFCKKQIDEDSSVILIKSIPTTCKKNVSCVKSMQR